MSEVNKKTKNLKFRLRFVEKRWVVLSHLPTRDATPCEVYFWMRMGKVRKEHIAARRRPEL